MTSAYDRYRAADLDLPEQGWAWNVYGAGEANMGKDDQPELLPIPEPNADQMLVRIDSVGLCFSDVKILRAGGSHPKLYNRDLSKDPTRLGHEVSVTVIAVGDNLKDRYHSGQRLAVQPDIYQEGKSTAYGYTIPGGLIQYHLMGSEMLDTGIDHRGIDRHTGWQLCRRHPVRPRRSGSFLRRRGVPAQDR